jgi:excisionase family DNA binding protein
MARSGNPSKAVSDRDRLPVATVSLAEAARVIGIGTSTAYRMAEAGTFPIPILRIGSRMIRVKKADLEHWSRQLSA